MSYDVVVEAALKLTPAIAKKWKAAKPVATKQPPAGFPKPEGKLQTTVAKVLALLEKSAELLEIDAKGGWNMRALLSEDAYIDLGPELVAIVNTAASLGARGELVFYGYDTAPAGIAYRITLAATPVFERLTSAAEKKLNASPKAKATAKWIERAVAANEQKTRVPATSKSFFKGFESVKDIVVDLLSAIQRADDKLLVDAVQKKGRLYYFYPKSFKTAQAIKKACHPEGRVLEQPILALDDVLTLLGRVDPTGAHAIGLRICDANAVPNSLWDATARLLAPTPDAPRLARRLLFRESYTSEMSNSERELREWAARLGGNPLVSSTMLSKRFEELVKQANLGAVSGYSLDSAADGPSDTAVLVAAALLLEKKAWDAVPAIANAAFTHPHWRLRTLLGELLTYADIPVAIAAPPLDKIGRGADRFLTQELRRRFKVDPGKAYVELAPQLDAGDLPTQLDVYRALFQLSAPQRKALYAKEPRWQPWGKKDPRTIRR